MTADTASGASGSASSGRNVGAELVGMDPMILRGMNGHMSGVIFDGVSGADSGSSLSCSSCTSLPWYFLKISIAPNGTLEGAMFVMDGISYGREKCSTRAFVIVVMLRVCLHHGDHA